MHLHPLGRLFLGCLLALPGLATAQTFSSGSTEADGPFNPPASVPPGTTVSGSTYTVPLPPSGVFHFTTISLPSGTAVKFAKNASNTPVILLASGNVTIAGILDVNGASATTYGRPGQGGPGGFSGGPGADGGFTSWYGTPGLGPGGGGMAYKAPGAGGGFGTAGTAGTCYAGSYDCAGAGTAAAGPAYGSPTLRPILGGSGGAGGYGVNAYGGGGGGGGGALLLASSGTITFTGQILANGGEGASANMSGGGGSGGAIRLIATTLTGTGGTLRAQGGGTGGGYGTGPGGDGRIRLEAYTLTLAIGGYSGGQLAPPASTAYPQPIFPAAGQPTLTITSVAGLPVPASPKGTFLDPPDISLPAGTTNPIPIGLTASHIPLGTVIRVTATAQGLSSSSADSSGLSGSLERSTATASLTVSLTRPSLLTATATYALVARAGEGPLFVEGEEVTHVKVAAGFGGASTLTYITKARREMVLK